MTNINLQLRRGEILGVAGLMGAGRSEVMEGIFGYVPAEKGRMIIHGKEREFHSATQLKQLKRVSASLPKTAS